MLGRGARRENKIMSAGAYLFIGLIVGGGLGLLIGWLLGSRRQTVALRELLAQFIFQPRIRRRNGLPARTQQPADEQAQPAADNQTNE